MTYWALTAVSLLATWLNVQGRRECFALWLATNAAWALVDWQHGLPQQATLHVIYFGLAAYGLLRWRVPPAAAAREEGA